jgi:hypothetical protein
MKKLALVTAVSTLVASGAYAAPVAYNGEAKSGTAANPLNSIVVQAGASTSVYYVDYASGAASNKTTPAIQLIRATNWTFDFANPAAVAFSGTIVYGDYRTQTNVSGVPTIDGRQSFTGVTQTVSGVGSYDEATNTFTFVNPMGEVNAGDASVHTQTSASCANGQTNFLGKVCTSFTQATPAWEGLTLSFVFSEDRSAFAGSLIANDTSGSGLTRNTTTINWQVAAEVPVPAAAWLFGSGLVGLAGAARRRSKKA